MDPTPAPLTNVDAPRVSIRDAQKPRRVPKRHPIAVVMNPQAVTLSAKVCKIVTPGHLDHALDPSSLRRRHASGQRELRDLDKLSDDGAVGHAATPQSQHRTRQHASAARR